ncbi:succinylglutamate desuccinylase, partial [Klebsiella pneumoniae]|nr:succinylglutamate desuccinylase [Klebsiella pneumoniae]
MEHLVNDLLHCRLQAWTFPAGIEARWLGAVSLPCTPAERIVAWRHG